MPASRHHALVRRVRATVVAVTASGVALTVFMACGGGATDEGSRGEQRAPASSAPSSEPSTAPSPAPVGSGWDRSPDSIAAVGDSITRGFDACAALSDCPQVSWATGTHRSVPSLAQRLLPQTTGHTWNLARSGAAMAELPGQLRRAAQRKPDLVTVLIGANDACRGSAARMTPVARFRADFIKALRVLRTSHPAGQIYVASVPDLLRLWSQGRTHPQAPRVWRLGVCQSMLSAPQSLTPAAVERRQRVQDRVRAFNEVLREVCTATPRCRHDGGAVFDYRFTSRELSGWDWFHPGKRGQRTLAEIAYQQVTAARQPA